MRNSIDQGTLIDIIAAGLPNFITDRINKEEVLETKDLFNEIGKLEHLSNRKKGVEKKNDIKKQKCGIINKIIDIAKISNKIYRY